MCLAKLSLQLVSYKLFCHTGSIFSSTKHLLGKLSICVQIIFPFKHYLLRLIDKLLTPNVGGIKLPKEKVSSIYQWLTLLTALTSKAVLPIR